MKRQSLLIVLVLLITLTVAACGAKEIEIPTFNGETITVATKDLSNEQVDALEAVADGSSDMMSLMRSGLFTPDELATIGLAGGMGGRGGMGQMSNVDIDDLNLEGLTDEQKEAIEAVIAGEMDIRELMNDGILTMEEMSEIGLMPDGGMRQGGMPQNKDTAPKKE